MDSEFHYWFMKNIESIMKESNCTNWSIISQIISMYFLDYFIQQFTLET